jgi:glycosyltransferase involved in cell wall biosynthesis
VTQSERKPRALIVSADRTYISGHPGNLGDALLTRALANELEARGFYVRIADFGSARLNEGERHLRLGGVGGLLRTIRVMDLVVIGGGTLVQDDAKVGAPWKGLPRLLLVSVLAARVTRTKEAMFGVGSNPVSRIVWARDMLSADLLAKQWNKSASLAADTALLQEIEDHAADDRGYLVLAAYAAEIATLTPSYLQGLRQQFGAIEFISMHQSKNSDAQAIPDVLRPYFRKVHESISLHEATEVVDGSSAVLSSRMHALYLGLLRGKPLVSLSNRPKIKSFRNEFGIPMSDPAGYNSRFSQVISPQIADSDSVENARRRISEAADSLAAYAGSTGSSKPSSQSPKGTSVVRVLMGYSTSKNTLNPFTSLLSRSINDVGDVALDFTWGRALFGSYDVLHLHWPEHLIQGRRGIRRLIVRAFVVILSMRLRMQRIPVVRTMHNLGAHEHVSRLDAWVLRRLELLTSARVIMNRSESFDDSMRTELIPHGHYRDWYVIDDNARTDGSTEGTRLLFFGLIRQYKGVETLLSAFRDVPEDDDMTLGVMGSSQDPDLSARLRKAEADDPRVALRLERIPDGELVSAIQRSDLIVLPYSDLYNSGALLLSMSCGTPVLVPDSAAAHEYAAELGRDWVITYQGELTASVLVEACKDLPDRGAAPDLSMRGWRLVGHRHHDLYRDLLAGTRKGVRK